jgi:hypothetical protein
MKNLIFGIIGLFVVSNLFAESVILKSKNGREQLLLKEEKSLQNSYSNQVYYLHGIVDKSTKIQSNGSLIISFYDSNIDYQNFAKNNNLTFKRVINKYKNIALFESEKDIDIVEKSNKLLELEEVKNSTPNWTRTRVLK